MSVSNELQALIYDRLTGSGGMAEAELYDRIPENAAFPYVSFGPSDTVEDDAECITGEVETLQLDCWSRARGWKELKDLTSEVKGLLHLYEGEFSTNALVELRVTSRRHFEDPDGITRHGVVTVQAIMEEV